MKTRILVGLWIVLGWPVMAQTNPVAGAAPANEISTASGAVYENVRVEKVEPDGLTVSYLPYGGGIGVVKIKFDELSEALQKKYGFDPQKKLNYEKLERQAAAQWRAQLIENYEAAVARRQAREAAEAEAEAQALAAATNQPPGGTNVIQPPPLQTTNSTETTEPVH